MSRERAELIRMSRVGRLARWRSGLCALDMVRINTPSQGIQAVSKSCSCSCKVGWADVLVMGRRVMFGEIIREVGASGFPADVVVFLDNAVAYPVIAHVDCAGSLAPDGVVHDTIGSGVVGGDGGGVLGVAHFGKGGSDNLAFFGVNKEGTDFSFRGGRGDVFEDAGGVEDGAVVARGFASEVEMAAGAAAGIGFVKVAGVAMDLE